MNDTTAPASAVRRFEYLDAKSAKFWEVEQAGAELNIRWGRIGAAGQSQTKAFADAAKAAAAMVKLIAEKTGKGYVEGVAAAGGGIGAAPPKTAAPVDSVDAQIERAFNAICAHIAAGTLPQPEEGLTPARIRRAHDVSELAAARVHKRLVDARLISAWSSVATGHGKMIAAGLMARRDAVLHAAPPGQGRTYEPADGAAPWLLRGEPVRLGDAGADVRWHALPTRRHPQPVKPVDAQKAWLDLRTRIAADIDLDAAGSDPGLREAVEAALESLQTRKLTGTPQSDAILLVLCLDRLRADGAGLCTGFVDYLVARHGLLEATGILLDAMRFWIDEDYSGRGKGIVRITYRTPNGRRYATHPFGDGVWRLRACLAEAPQDVYDACAVRAAASIEALDLERQTTLALLFPDVPELAHGVIARADAAGGNAKPVVHWLQLNAVDEALLSLARKIRPDAYDNFWSRSDMASTVLLEHGLDAVRWLAPGADQEAAGDALARIGTPEAVEALARVAGTSKHALARFALAVERWPLAAAAALARVLGGSGREQGLLTPTLLDLLRNDPSLPALLRPWLEPAANALLDTLVARLAGPADVAASADLPEVLANPPWLRAKKKAAASLQLETLPLAGIERWDEGEKEAFLELQGWYRRYRESAASPDAMAGHLGFSEDGRNPAFKVRLKEARDAIARGDAPGLLAAWRGMLDEKKKERWYWYRLSGHAVGHLPPALGVPFWNAAAAEAPATEAGFVAATFGMAAFPGVLARITSAPAENLQVALHFGVVELAPVAARAFARLKSLRGLGRQWLKRFPEHAACGLIAPALSKPGEARDSAAAALRYLAGSGHLPLLEEVAARYGQPDVLPALHAMLNEDPLDRYPNRRAALPEFWKPDGWRRPVLAGGKALPDAALDALGTMMMFPTGEETYAGLYAVREACTPESLADFAWDCFSAWLNASAPSKDNWALLNLGFFGTDDTARKLTAFIRAWPGEAAHARAVTGLDVLAAIGSDVALMLLNGIAQKVKFKGLQDKAREKITAIAEARGLTPEELEDRLAPDLGLDEGGSMVLDFGLRAFKVGFDEALKPYVREWNDGRAGTRLPDLPKPRKTDDEALAAGAVERFKLLKKDARTVASQQVLRLELAMCARRRWSPAVFAQFLAGHPLVRHLVRRLVWGVYAMPLETSGEGEDAETRVASYGGSLTACFRVAEDGQYTTASDDPFALPGGEQYKIGLPHALELPANEAADFGQLFADYELLQPFQQLGRDTYALIDAERASTRLLRWQGVKVPTGKVLGLANIGWRRGPAQDNGCIWTFDKAAGATHTLELTLDPGIIVGMLDEEPEQALCEITLGPAARSRWGANGDLSTFAALDPIVASELIRDMERLLS